MSIKLSPFNWKWIKRKLKMNAQPSPQQFKSKKKKKKRKGLHLHIHLIFFYFSLHIFSGAYLILNFMFSMQIKTPKQYYWDVNLYLDIKSLSLKIISINFGLRTLLNIRFESFLISLSSLMWEITTLYFEDMIQDQLIMYPIAVLRVYSTWLIALFYLF